MSAKTRTYYRTATTDSKVFPYMLTDTHSEIQGLAIRLLDDKRRITPGPAFAVTVNDDNSWNIWLTSESYGYIIDMCGHGN